MRKGDPMRGKVVVITGAAGGIGREMARRFGRAGARIGLLDRQRDAVEALAAELAGEGIEAHPAACDVTRQDDCDRAMAEVARRFGGVDVLVNNAGITHLSPATETQPSVLRAVMEVNYFGAVHATHAAMPWLTERRGTIVVISSVAGFAPLVDRCGYAASKHALHGYFETLRAEVRPRGLHVVMVCPSFTRTAIARSALGGSGAATDRPWTTTGRLASPDEVAEAVYRGVVRRRRVVLPTAVSRLAWYASRLLPALYERMMVRKLRPPEAA